MRSRGASRLPSKSSRVVFTIVCWSSITHTILHLNRGSQGRPSAEGFRENACTIVQPVSPLACCIVSCRFFPDRDTLYPVMVEFAGARRGFALGLKRLRAHRRALLVPRLRSAAYTPSKSFALTLRHYPVASLTECWPACRLRWPQPLHWASLGRRTPAEGNQFRVATDRIDGPAHWC